MDKNRNYSRLHELTAEEEKRHGLNEALAALIPGTDPDPHRYSIVFISQTDANGKRTVKNVVLLREKVDDRSQGG